MKQLFRFFRGELNGFFIKAVCVFPNLYLKTSEILDELYYQMRFQWVLDGQQTKGEAAIRTEDLYGLGKIGGLFQPRGFARSSMGSVWFAPSSKVQYPSLPERSERGLVREDYEDFMFVRVEHDDYPTDIEHEASKQRRMTFVPKGAKILGYVPADRDLFDHEGKVIIESLLAVPPTNQPFIEFYGLKYLHYEESFDAELPLTPDVYKMLFEELQQIRRNGASLKALMDLTQIMGEGYIYDIEIEQQEYWYLFRYSLDDNAQVYNRERRYNAWLEVTAMKFKEFVFINRIGEV